MNFCNTDSDRRIASLIKLYDTNETILNYTVGTKCRTTEGNTLSEWGTFF
jgi:hypothetical protein